MATEKQLKYWESLRGKKLSDEIKEKLKGRTPWNKGGHHSEETKKKISEYLKKNPISFWKGKKLSEEHKIKLSESHKGYIMPLEQRNKIGLKKEKHPNWKGNNAGYNPIHCAIARAKGKPQKCEHCGRTDKKKYEWANIDHKYRRVLEDYIRLCTLCHRAYDMKFNNYKKKCK